MNKIKNLMTKHPVGFYGIAFGVLSLVLNLVWVGFSGMAHIYDIIHVFPVIFIYEPIIDLLGGGMPSPFIFIPLAVIMDALIGLMLGWIVCKITKAKEISGWVLAILFAIYWIVVTFQWVPII